MVCKTKKRNLHSSITTVRDVKNSARHIHVITLPHDEKRTTQKRYGVSEKKLFESKYNTGSMKKGSKRTNQLIAFVTLSGKLNNSPKFVQY